MTSRIPAFAALLFAATGVVCHTAQAEGSLPPTTPQLDQTGAGSYPDARRAVTGADYDYGEVSAGLRWRALSARYSYVLSRDLFGVPDARGSSYVDFGMRHDLGHAMSVMLHAGDGHVAGAGNGMWDWRDLKAGLSRKLDGGWLLALNYTRALGAAGPYDRATLPAARPDGRPAFQNAGRRALVLSMARSF